VLLNIIISKGNYMGWFEENLMIFYKIDESIVESTAGSLSGPKQCDETGDGFL
jgi:hypothetical protein